MQRPNVKLGDKARDTITGYEGIVVCISNWIAGCQRVTLQAQDIREGKPVDQYTVDVEQLEVITPQKVPTASPTGGPCPEPTRAQQG